MPQKITWTEAADAEILHRRAEGATWDSIAHAIGVSRNAVLGRAQALREGRPEILAPRRPAPRDDAAAAEQDADRPPLPPGHPIAWTVLTEGTGLAGAAYPDPMADGRRRFRHRGFRSRPLGLAA